MSLPPEIDVVTTRNRCRYHPKICRYHPKSFCISFKFCYIDKKSCHILCCILVVTTFITGEKCMDYHELYAKENSTVQLPLFHFGKGKRPKIMITEWGDAEKEYKLECNCKYGVPGSFEQDVYTATMRIWLKQGMGKEVVFNYSDIARELHLNPPKDYVKQIREAMRRLAMARYEFTKCFLMKTEDGVESLDVYFSLYDSASLFAFDPKDKKMSNKRRSKNIIIFPKELQNNLENRYYQYLEMTWYRALPEGLSRRLYEYLEKRRYHNINGEFTISEEVLCRWLPVLDKHSTRRRKTLAHIAQALIEKGYLRGYRFDLKRGQCIFTYASQYALPLEEEKELLETVAPIKEEGALKQMLEKALEQPERKDQMVSPQEQEKYLEALNWLDSVPHFHKARKKEIASLPLAHVAKHYPGIKASYEKQKEAGNVPKVGWVYKAFMDGWSFSEGIAKKPETPKEKLERLLDEAWDSLPLEEQERYKQEYLEYIKPIDLDGSLVTNKCVFRHMFLKPELEKKGLIPKMNLR